jgi:hypothetical protein
MRIVITGLVAALALTSAAEAQAFDWYESKTKSIYAGARSHSCAAPDYVDVQAPSYARNPEAVSPWVGDQFDAYEGGDGDKTGMVQVTAREPVDNAVRFALLPVGGWCAPYYEGEDDEGHWYNPDEGWESKYREYFEIRYQVQKRLVLRGQASSLADEAVARHISWWYHSDGGPAHCRVYGNRAHCQVGDVIGDVVFDGVIKLRLIGRSGRNPVWSYRLTGRKINEYCRYVTHAGNCIDRIKKRRSRVTLPSWVRARTAG